MTLAPLLTERVLGGESSQPEKLLLCHRAPRTNDGPTVATTYTRSRAIVGRSLFITFQRANADARVHPNSDG